MAAKPAAMRGHPGVSTTAAEVSTTATVASAALCRKRYRSQQDSERRNE
jgi:hypothetical protein